MTILWTPSWNRQKPEAFTTPQRASCVHSILVLDDSRTVLDLFRAILSADSSFTVIEALSCAAALKVAETAAVDLLIADLRLPDGLGTSVAVQLQSRNKLLKVIFTSGIPIEFWAEGARQEANSLALDTWRWLAKPFFPQTAMGMVRKLLC